MQPLGPFRGWNFPIKSVSHPNHNNHGVGFMKSYARTFYESFRRIHGYTLAFIAIILHVLAFEFKGDDTFSIKTVLPCAIVLILVIVILFDMSYQLITEAHRLPPRVKRASRPPQIHERAVALLLLEPSPLYGHESLVSIYLIDNDLETLLGVGFVLNIQENRLIQLLVTKSYCDLSHWEPIISNDASILSRLLVKPTIPLTLDKEGLFI